MLNKGKFTNRIFRIKTKKTFLIEKCSFYSFLNLFIETN